MHEIGLIDDSFERIFSSRYHLSIQLGLDGFSFSILDPDQNKFLYLRHIPFVLQREHLLACYVEKIFQEEEILSDKYAKVTVLYKTSRCTFVPTTFYKNNERDRLFSFNHQLNECEQVFVCPLPKVGANVLFPIPREVCVKIRERHPEVEFFHIAFPLIEQALRSGNSANGKHVVTLFCSKSFFDLVVCHNNNLIFFNQFTFRNETDFVFFLLNVFEQLNLDPTRTPVLVSGMLPRNSEHYVLMRKYIQNIQVEQPGKTIQYSIRFRQIPLHFFTPLFNLYTCV